MKKAPIAALLAALFTLAGCSNGGGGADSAPKAAPGQNVQPTDDGDPPTRSIGETVTLADDEGNPMQVTPTGIAYRDALAKDKTLAVNGRYALASTS
jgi:hypothetical protein